MQGIKVRAVYYHQGTFDWLWCFGIKILWKSRLKLKERDKDNC